MNSMYKRVLLAAISTVVLITFVVGCGRGTVAKVNGRKITKQEYYNRLEHLRYADPMTRQQMEAGQWVLQQLINEELLLRLAESEGVDPTEEQVKERMEQVQKQPNFRERLKEAGVTKEQFKAMMRVEQAAFNVQTKGVKITDKEIREFYDKNKDTLYTTPEHAYVAAIFAESKADADKAMNLLKKGVQFETVARTVSSAKELAEEGGRLPQPIIRGGSLPQFVQDAVLSTQRGKYTNPIPGGDGGFIIFKVIRHLPREVKKFNDAKFDARQQLLFAKSKEKTNLEAKLISFRKKADIEINVDRYEKPMKEAFKKAKPATTTVPQVAPPPAGGR